MIFENHLKDIMKSLTNGWHWGPKATKQLCDHSFPNWLAYMGLMETYEIKCMAGNNKSVGKEWQ